MCHKTQPNHSKVRSGQGVVAPDRVRSMGQIELKRGFECLLFLYLNCIFMQNWIV